MIRIPQVVERKISKMRNINLFGNVRIIQIAVFAKTLALMLRSGVPIGKALMVAQETTSGRFKMILNDVIRAVGSGNPFFASVAVYPDVFSPFFISTVKVGEAAGTLSDSLEIVAKELMKTRALVSKIRTALIYPMMIMTASVALGLIMSFFILPKLIPLLTLFSVDMPLPTRVLLWFANTMKNYGIFIIGGVVVLSIGFSILIKQTFVKPFTHSLILKIPILKRMVRAFNVSRFCRTLGTMISSGINIDSALAITADATVNMRYRRVIVTATQRISKGTKLSASIEGNEELFPLLMVRMILTGEESGRLPEIFIYLADFYEEELDDATKAFSAVFEPLLILLIGGVVVFLALAVITPIFKITGSIGN